MNWTKPFLHIVLNIISLKLSVIKSTWADYVKNWLKAFGQRHLINVFIGMHTNLLWCSHLLMSSSQTEDMSYDYLNELIEGQIPRKSPWLSQFILSSLRLNQEEREKNVVRNVVKFLRFFPVTHLRRTCQRLTISCRLLSWHMEQQTPYNLPENQNGSEWVTAPNHYPAGFFLKSVMFSKSFLQN